LLLLGRAEHVEDLRVAGVGRLAAEDELRVRRAPDLLVQVRVREEALAGPSGLGRHVRGPEAGVLRLRLERPDQPLVVGLELPFVRVDVLLHERAVARSELAHCFGRC
jgi:hypothetical protein